MALTTPALAAEPTLYQWTLTGTGFVVNPAGDVVTNAHVVKDCRTISVLTPAGEQSAQLTAIDPKHDIAALKTNYRAKNIAPMRWEVGHAQPGDRVTLLGYPGTAGEEGKLQAQKTKIMSLKGPNGEEEWLQLARAATQGNSGGPVLDAAGNVIGMLTGIALTYHVDAAGNAIGTPVAQVDYAITLPSLQDFLRKNGIGFDDHDSGFASMGDDQLRNTAREFIVRVRCVQDTVLR